MTTTTMATTSKKETKTRDIKMNNNNNKQGLQKTHFHLCVCINPIKADTTCTNDHAVVYRIANLCSSTIAAAYMSIVPEQEG